MPVYGYRCEKCGEEFEVLHGVNAPAVTTHEGCGGAVQRIFYPVGVIFKGSGFYSTDNRKKSGGDPAKSSESRPVADKPSESKPSEAGSGGQSDAAAAPASPAAGGGSEAAKPAAKPTPASTD